MQGDVKPGVFSHCGARLSPLALRLSRHTYQLHVPPYLHECRQWYVQDVRVECYLVGIYFDIETSAVYRRRPADAIMSRTDYRA